MVQYLCEQEADKVARDRYCETPLYVAEKKGRISVVQYSREQLDGDL